jgi:hypothetical protein
MKTVYRIDAWCICKDQVTMDSIAASLVNSLQTQKTNGNITSGNIMKTGSDTPETVVVNTGV